MNPSFNKILKGSQGLALFMVIFVMAFFLLFVTGGLIFSQLDLKKASNLKLATQVLEVADAGLQHALAVIPSGSDFNTHLSCASPPCTIVPSTTFPPGSDFSYTVTAENDPPDMTSPGSPTNDTNGVIILKSKASGPSGAQKMIQAYVKRSSSGFTPPGAVYILGQSLWSTVLDDGFLFTGNDTKSDGTAGPKPAIHGVSASSTTVRDAFLISLSSSQLDNVQGKDYSSGPPIQPSVATTSETLDAGSLAAKFKAKIPSGSPCPPLCLDGLVVINKTLTLGTVVSPQITYIEEGKSPAHFDGNVSGVGVLVTVGRSRLYGDFNFRGLIITAAKADAGSSESDRTLALRSGARIYGGVILGPQTGTNWLFGLYTRSTAKLYYSSEDFAIAYSLCPECFPKPARILAWLDR